MYFSDLGRFLSFLVKFIAVVSNVALPDNISGTISGNKERSSPNCTILASWVFDNFMLANELFEKVLWSLEACLSFKKNYAEN